MNQVELRRLKQSTVYHLPVTKGSTFYNLRAVRSLAAYDLRSTPGHPATPPKMVSKPPALAVVPPQANILRQAVL